MRFLHLADLHLGKTVNGFSMLEDQSFMLRQLLQLASAQQVQAVLISGDVYDRPVPPEDAVRELDSFLMALHTAGIQVLVISGNHDSDERLQFGSALMAAGGVHIAGAYRGQLPCVTLTDSWGPVHFWMLPFVRAATVAHFHPGEDCGDYGKAIRTAVSHTGLDPQERNVLLAHQFVTGDREPELSGSERILPGSLGTVERVGADAFSAFDYVALGHIHRAQPVGRESCRYAGSPLKYARSEIGRDKSVPLVTLGPKGQCEVELLQLQPLRDMRELRGSLETILTGGSDSERENYVFVTLTDESLIPGAVDRVRERWPRLMGLSWDNSRTRALADSEAAARVEQSYEELVAAFFQRVLGTDPTAEELEMLRQAAEEAGVLK